MSVDSDNDWIVAWIPPDTGQAEMAKEILNQEGIDVHIEGSYMSVSTLGLNVKAWIPRKDAQRARSILVAYGFLREDE